MTTQQLLDVAAEFVRGLVAVAAVVGTVQVGLAMLGAASRDAVGLDDD